MLCSVDSTLLPYLYQARPDIDRDSSALFSALKLQVYHMYSGVLRLRFGRGRTLAEELSNKDNSKGG